MKKATLIIGALGIATSTLNAQVFSHSMDFEPLSVGDSPATLGGAVWITGSWWADGSTNCGDGTVSANGSNAAVIEVGATSSCNDRPGVIVGSGSMPIGNDVMCLNFRPGKYPDTVSFVLNQFAVTNTGTVTAYDEDNMVLDAQSFGSGSASVSISGVGEVSRIEIANAHAFSLDDLAWSGIETDGSYMKTVDFENDLQGPVSGNYGVVHFRTLAGYECGTGNAGDGTSPLAGAQCLVLDGGNANNDPDDGCSNSVHGVAIAANGDPNYAGTMGAFFHPAAQPTVVSFDLRQHAITGPINILAYDFEGEVIFTDTSSTHSDSIMIKASNGIDRVEIEGLFPFTVDDFAMSGVGEDIPCIADFNDDGVLDIFDVFAYLELFNTGCP